MKGATGDTPPASAAERALTKLKKWTQDSVEPGERINPIATMKMDRNGLCYGEAPRMSGPGGLAAHSGAYREVANGADVLADLVYQHELEKEKANPSTGQPPMPFAAHHHPIVFVNAEDKDLVIRQTDSGDVSVVALAAGNYNLDELQGPDSAGGQGLGGKGRG